MCRALGTCESVTKDLIFVLPRREGKNNSATKKFEEIIVAEDSPHLADIDYRKR